MSLFNLADRYKYQAGRKKYLNRMSPCIFKSVQLLLNRLLFPKRNREVLNEHGVRIYPDYFDEGDEYWQGPDFEEYFDGYHDDIRLSEKDPVILIEK